MGDTTVPQKRPVVALVFAKWGTWGRIVPIPFQTLKVVPLSHNPEIARNYAGFLWDASVPQRPPLSPT